MRIVGFVEGCRIRSGGMGLVGVPSIYAGLAALNHEAILLIAGGSISTDETAERRGVKIVRRAAWGRWRFTPALAGLGTMVREADFVMLHGVYSFPVLVGHILCRLHQKPYGVWPHGVFAPPQRRLGRVRKAIYDFVITGRLLTSAAIIFYSAVTERDEAAQAGLRVPSIIVPHGVDTGSYQPNQQRARFRDKFLAGHRGPLILYLGRLNPKKGLELLIDAVRAVRASVPDLRLAIVGPADPPEFKDKVEGWIAESDLTREVVVTGRIGEVEKLDAYTDADAFVLPSEAENFGLALFEALSVGVPSIVSDRVAFAAEMRAAGAAVVTELSRAGLTDALRSVLTDEQLRLRLRRNGPEFVKGFSWETSSRLLEEGIRCVVSDQPFPQSLQPARATQVAHDRAI